MWSRDNHIDYLKRPTTDDTAFVTGGKVSGSGVLNSLTQTVEKDSYKDSDSDSVDGQQPGAHRKVIVDIYDEEDLGDDRLTPETLRLLLESRQDLAIMLYECAIEEGLTSADDKFYNDEPEGQSYES